MLMTLGTFVFDLPRLAYQQLEQQMSWRHAASERVGARAAHQLPVKQLKRVFASLLFVLAAYMLWKGVAAF